MKKINSSKYMVLNITPASYKIAYFYKNFRRENEYVKFKDNILINLVLRKYKVTQVLR